MTPRHLIPALFALAMWLAGGLFACAGQPKHQLALVFHGSNNSATLPGSMHVTVKASGWKGYVRQHVTPAIAWCEASNVEPVILLHLAFGQWLEQMHLDNLDYARASGEHWITAGFIEAWEPVARKAKCITYVGSIGVHPHLTALPAEELAATIRRNVQPFVDAGFQQACMDHTRRTPSCIRSTPTAGSWSTARWTPLS